MLIFISVVLSVVLSEITLGLSGVFLVSYFRLGRRSPVAWVLMITGIMPSILIAIALTHILFPPALIVILPIIALAVIGLALFLRFGVAAIALRLMSWSSNLGERTRVAMDQWRTERSVD
jgi:hypothetical protein